MIGICYSHDKQGWGHHAHWGQICSGDWWWWDWPFQLEVKQGGRDMYNSGDTKEILYK